MKIYTKQDCNKCEEIKKRLIEANVPFVSADILVDMKELEEYIHKNPNVFLPIIRFDDGSIVASNEGLLKELKKRGILSGGK